MARRKTRPDPNTVANALDALQARVRPTYPPSHETFAELRARPEFARAFEVPGVPGGGVLLYAEAEIEGAMVPMASGTVLPVELEQRLPAGADNPPRGVRRWGLGIGAAPHLVYMRGEIGGEREAPAAGAIRAHEVGVAPGGARPTPRGAIRRVTRPCVAAREPKEDREAAEVSALALERAERLLDRVDHEGRERAGAPLTRRGGCSTAS